MDKVSCVQELKLCQAIKSPIYSFLLIAVTSGIAGILFLPPPFFFLKKTNMTCFHMQYLLLQILTRIHCLGPEGDHSWKSSDGEGQALFIFWLWQSSKLKNIYTH